MNLIRKIVLTTATHDFQVSFKHIPGVCNAISDALSHLQVQLFRQLAPQADPEPTELPADIYMAGLVKTMKAYQKASLAKSSRPTYRVGLRHYRKFCKSFRHTQFPPSQLTLRLFVTHLANTVSFKSIKLYLSAVKFKAVELGFRNNFQKMSQFHLYFEESSVS